jgi:hypothetical protein
MSAADLKKSLKELRPKFTSVEEEVAYHTAAKKALANKEKMAKLREMKKANKSDKAPLPTASSTEGPASPPPKKKAQKKTEAATPVPVSAKREALLAQLAALGSA